MSHTNLQEATVGGVEVVLADATHDERDLSEEGPPPDPIVQLTGQLQSMLDTLYTTIRLYHEAAANLEATQKRCNELLEENRALKKERDGGQP